MNPQSKLYEIIKYLMSTSQANSRTWSAHIKHLAKMYNIPDPLLLIDQTPWKKETWKNFIKTKIITFHEKEQRSYAAENNKMCWLNVSMSGLSGKSHLIPHGISTAHEIQKLTPAFKMLCGDFLTYSIRADQSGGSPHCRICSNDCSGPSEDILHILTECTATSATRIRILKDLEETISGSHFKGGPKNTNELDLTTLIQFILDCTSMNLQNKYKININDPQLTQIFKVTRDLIFAISQERMRLLKSKQDKQQLT